MSSTLKSIRMILESMDGEPVEISKLVRSEAGVANAHKSGDATITNKPVAVTKTPRGDVVLLDGYHRVHHAIKSGDSHINAIFHSYENVKPLLLDDTRFLRHGQLVGDKNAETKESLGITE